MRTRTAETLSRDVQALKPYAAILNARLLTLLQYRAAAIAGFGTQLFWGLIRVSIFTAFFRSSNRSQPINLPDTISYLWLTQAMLTMVMWRTDADVTAMIRTGTVSYEMLRPVDLYGMWYARAVAARLAPMLLRGLPMIIIASVFFSLRPPPTLPNAICWLIATCAALLLSAAITTLLTISLLYTISGDGLLRIVPPIVFALSGMLVPLPLMPGWLQGTLRFLPFSGLIDVPFRLYLGHISPSEYPALLCHQLLWTFVFIAAGRYALDRALQRMVVQGG